TPASTAPDPRRVAVPGSIGRTMPNATSSRKTRRTRGRAAGGILAGYYSVFEAMSAGPRLMYTALRLQALQSSVTRPAGGGPVSGRSGLRSTSVEPQEGHTSGLLSRSAAISTSASGARYSLIPLRPTTASFRWPVAVERIGGATCRNVYAAGPPTKPGPEENADATNWRRLRGTAACRGNRRECADGLHYGHCTRDRAHAR